MTLRFDVTDSTRHLQDKYLRLRRAGLDHDLAARVARPLGEGLTEGEIEAATEAVRVKHDHRD